MTSIKDLSLPRLHSPCVRIWIVSILLELLNDGTQYLHLQSASTPQDHSLFPLHHQANDLLSTDVVRPTRSLVAGERRSRVVPALLRHILRKRSGVEVRLDGGRVAKDTGPGADGHGDGEVEA